MELEKLKTGMRLQGEIDLLKTEKYSWEGIGHKVTGIEIQTGQKSFSNVNLEIFLPNDYSIKILDPDVIKGMALANIESEIKLREKLIEQL